MEIKYWNDWSEAKGGKHHMVTSSYYCQLSKVARAAATIVAH